MDWTSNFFVIVTLTLTGSILLLLWLPLQKWLGKRGYVSLPYFLLIAIGFFCIVPVAYIPFWIQLYKNWGTQSLAFLPTPPLYHSARLFFLIWLVGILFRLVRYGISVRQFQKIRRSFRPAPAASRELLERCRKEMGIRRSVVLLEGYGVPSPMLRGVWKPQIILPADHTYTPEEMRCVFFHELTHQRHGDIFFKSLLVCIACIHWFNPFLSRAMNRYFDEWSEAYCDETVCRTVNNHKLYYESLRKAAVAAKRYSSLLCARLYESQNGIVRRIQRMEQNRKIRSHSRKAAVLIAAAFLLAGNATAFAAGAEITQIHETLYYLTEPEAIQEEAAPPTTAVEYTAKTEDWTGETLEGEVQESRASTSFEWAIPARTRVQTPEFYRNAGDQLSVSILPTPLDASFRLGITEPDGTRRYILCNGNTTHTFSLTQSGSYRIYVENTSGSTISVVGTYV